MCNLDHFIYILNKKLLLLLDLIYMNEVENGTTQNILGIIVQRTLLKDPNQK